MFFSILVTLVIVQRIVELFIARKNERWILQQGGYEVGASHYPLMALMHIAFFITLIGEVTLFERDLSFWWVFFFILFFIMQIGRFWCLSSLGKFWNTKIMILPNINVVKKGPYRFLKHPNYVIVSLELLTLPLLFNAYITAIIFTLLNGWILAIRIPIEEKALKEATNYKTT